MELGRLRQEDFLFFFIFQFLIFVSIGERNNISLVNALSSADSFSLMQNPLAQDLSESSVEGGGNRSDSSGIEIIENPSLESSVIDPSSHVLHFVLKNVGNETENLTVDVSDEQGFVQKTQPPTEFNLPSGSSKDISVRVIDPVNKTVSVSPDIITIVAKSKEGKIVKRSAYYYPGSDFEYSQQYQPFCYDRYVTGTCRYRTDPYNCDQYKWTAYATIQSSGGIQQLRSIPEGLYIPPEFQPGTRDRMRVYLTVSCCIPIVQFISVNPYHPNVGNACIVDVRELQILHPGEIAGIVFAAVAFLIIVITIVTLLIRQRKNQTILVGHTSTTRERESTSRERE